MTVFFTSDTHYGHRRINEYCQRPFKDSTDAIEGMITNWNNVVSPGDLVYHLGDFALCPVEQAVATARRLHGQKYLIFGNHDKALRKSVEFLACWIWAKDLTQIEVEGQKITLCHYAMRTWNQAHRGAWQLYGHSHGSLPDQADALSLDVGVDCWNYTPVSFGMIKDRMTQKTFVPVDHHGAE